MKLRRGNEGKGNEADCAFCVSSARGGGKEKQIRPVFLNYISWSSSAAYWPVKIVSSFIGNTLTGVAVAGRMPLTSRYRFDGLQIKIHRKLLKRREQRAIREWLASIPPAAGAQPASKRTRAGFQTRIQPRFGWSSNSAIDVFASRSFRDPLIIDKGESTKASLARSFLDEIKGEKSTRNTMEIRRN